MNKWIAVRLWHWIDYTEVTDLPAPRDQTSPRTPAAPQSCLDPVHASHRAPLANLVLPSPAVRCGSPGFCCAAEPTAASSDSLPSSPRPAPSRRTAGGRTDTTPGRTSRPNGWDRSRRGLMKWGVSQLPVWLKKKKKSSVFCCDCKMLLCYSIRYHLHRSIFFTDRSALTRTCTYRRQSYHTYTHSAVLFSASFSTCSWREEFLLPPVGQIWSFKWPKKHDSSARSVHNVFVEDTFSHSACSSTNDYTLNIYI